jgi:hypothetical protein
MGKHLLSLIFLGILCVPALGQEELPSNFFIKRETDQQTGNPIFLLSAHPDSIAYDAVNGNTFEALGAVVQPDIGKYVITLMNAKKAYQMTTGRDKSCSVTIDAENFSYPKFIWGAGGRARAGKLRIETVLFAVKRDVFDKLLEGNDIRIRCGSVRYNLDQDNIDALRYFGREVAADSERRKKPN